MNYESVFNKLFCDASEKQKLESAIDKIFSSTSPEDVTLAATLVMLCPSVSNRYMGSGNVKAILEQAIDDACRRRNIL